MMPTGWSDRRGAAALWLRSLQGVPDNFLYTDCVNICLNILASADVQTCGGFFYPISQWANVVNDCKLGKLTCDASSNLVPRNACCSR